MTIISANRDTTQPTANRKLNATSRTGVVLERRPSPSMVMWFIPTELQGKKRVRLSQSRTLANKSPLHQLVLSEVLAHLPAVPKFSFALLNDERDVLKH
jgi:hypothetical protein